MRIYLWEMRANFKSLLIWIMIAAFIVVVGFSKYSAYAENPELVAMLDSMPEVMLESFNMSAFNLTTVEGFFGVIYAFLGLILSIAAVLWGSEIISKEERDKTVEFALTLPVKRTTLVSAKAAAALTNSLVLALAVWAMTAVSAGRYNPDPDFYRFLYQGILALVLVQLVFLALGVLLGCSLQGYKRSSSLAVSLLLGTYFISILIELREEWELLRYFSPFTYFDPAAILFESRIELEYVFLSAGLILCCLIAAYILYSRRDLYL